MRATTGVGTVDKADSMASLRAVSVSEDAEWA